MEAQASAQRAESEGQSQPPQGIDYDALANRRIEVEDDKRCRLHLQDWKEQKKQEQLSVESYRGRCIAAKSELYQLMGFYFVFQGVVFTAVAQTTKLHCQTSFSPALLSGLASIATVISVHEKLTYYKSQKLKFIAAEAIKQTVDSKIFDLRFEGKNFNFRKLGEYDQKIRKQVEDGQAKEEKARGQTYRAVMWFLAVFSIIIFGSCFLVLCWKVTEGGVPPC